MFEKNSVPHFNSCVIGIYCNHQVRERERNPEMMNKEQAIAYGKRTGVKYYVKNSLGGLLGGTKTYGQAVDMKRRLEAKAANGIKVFIVEA